MEAPAFAVEAAARWSAMTRWERAEAGRALRRLGWTYGEIMEVLPVGKGTLSGWCREIRLTPEQIGAIKARRPPGVRTGIPVDTQRKRHREIERIRAEARTFALDHVSDSFFVAGVVLYWAEGMKTRPMLALANSDERALRFFNKWVRTFHDRDARFVLALHLHAGNNEPAARQHWAARLDLGDPDFHRTFIKPAGTGHRKNNLTYGVCRVTVRCSADAWHRTMAWIDAVSEKFGVAELLTCAGVAGATGSAGDS